MEKKEIRKKNLLKNRLVQDKTLLNWTLGSTGSGARLRNTNQEVISEVKRIIAKRESVASRLNRLERSGSPYKKSGADFWKTQQAHRGSIILLEAGATPKRGQRSLEPSKKNSMNLIDLERNKTRLKRTITLTNQEDMKEFSQHAALSRVDYMLKKLQDKERKITELDYEYHKENQYNIFSKLSHSSSRNSSRKPGALSPIDSHRDSIFQAPILDRMPGAMFTPPRESYSPNEDRIKQTSPGRSIMSSELFNIKRKTSGGADSKRWSFIYGYLGLPSDESRFNYDKKVALMQGTKRTLPFEKQSDDFATYRDSCLKSATFVPHERFSIENARKYLNERRKGLSNQRAIAKTYKISCVEYLERMKTKGTLSLKAIPQQVYRLSVSGHQFQRSGSDSHLKSMLYSQIDSICSSMKQKLSTDYLVREMQRNRPKQELQDQTRILAKMGVNVLQEIQPPELPTRSRTEMMQEKLNEYREKQRGLLEQIKQREREKEKFIHEIKVIEAAQERERMRLQSAQAHSRTLPFKSIQKLWALGKKKQSKQAELQI